MKTRRSNHRSLNAVLRSRVCQLCSVRPPCAVTIPCWSWLRWGLRHLKTAESGDFAAELGGFLFGVYRFSIFVLRNLLGWTLDSGLIFGQCIGWFLVWLFGFKDFLGFSTKKVLKIIQNPSKTHINRGLGWCLYHVECNTQPVTC